LVAAYISAAESIATSAAVTTITHRIYEAILHLHPLPHPICADGQAAGRGRNLRREAAIRTAERAGMDGAEAF
jgi:hypothetical protein